jgi:hypothetical protein
MRTYLKKHTFLVNVKVDSFKNIQTFQQLSDIINKVKPTYTQPIYVWSITAMTEELTLTDDLSTYRLDPSRCEKIQYPIARMRRDNTDDPIKRGCPTFIRSNVPQWVTKILGTNELINGTQTTVNGGSLSGFINPQAQFRENTTPETSWLTTMFQRDHDQVHIRRNKVAFNRGRADLTVANGKAVSWYDIPAGMRVIPIYITKQYDIAAKCLSVGTDIPPTGQWVFTIFNPSNSGQAINVAAINDSGSSFTINPLVTFFNTLFFRGTDVGYLGALIPELGFQAQYAPTPADITLSDYLMGVRILEDTVGIYWVTGNQSIDAPQYFPVDEMDRAVITYDMPLTRGHQAIGTPQYTLRGADLVYPNDGSEIDGAAINEESGYNNSVSPNTYSDKYNSSVTITRGGTVITHAQELS